LYQSGTVEGIVLKRAFSTKLLPRISE